MSDLKGPNEAQVKRMAERCANYDIGGQQDAMKIIALGAERNQLARENARQADELARLRDALEQAEAKLACGHPASLAIMSAEEPGKFLYCDLCNCRSERNDALQMEAELRQKLAQAQRRLAETLAKLADWQQLVQAAMLAGAPKIEGLSLPALWPNKWHQDCAMVAYTIKNLHDALAAARREGMERAEQVCQKLICTDVDWGGEDEYDEGVSHGVGQCVQAIRAEIEKERK